MRGILILIAAAVSTTLVASCGDSYDERDEQAFLDLADPRGVLDAEGFDTVGYGDSLCDDFGISDDPAMDFFGIKLSVASLYFDLFPSESENMNDFLVAPFRYLCPDKYDAVRDAVLDGDEPDVIKDAFR